VEHKREEEINDVHVSTFSGMLLRNNKKVSSRRWKGAIGKSFNISKKRSGGLSRKREKNRDSEDEDGSSQEREDEDEGEDDGDNSSTESESEEDENDEEDAKPASSRRWKGAIGKSFNNSKKRSGGLSRKREKVAKPASSRRWKGAIGKSFNNSKKRSGGLSRKREKIRDSEDEDGSSQEGENDGDNSSTESESEEGEVEGEVDGGDDGNEEKETGTNDSSHGNDEEEGDGTENDDKDGDDDSDQHEGAYNVQEFEDDCRAGRYAAGTLTKLAERFNAMKKWMHENEAECECNKWLPLKKPFDEGLCKRYVFIQMHRKKKGALLGTGNLNAIIQMLKYEGFTKEGDIVPQKLDRFFKDAHEHHKRTIATRVAECKQELSDHHAQNSSWAAVQYCAEQLHDWKPGRKHHTSSHLYFLGSVQAISRGERVGKIPLSSFRKGNSGNHICAGKGLSTKTDPKGRRSYNKRFWCNYTDPKMCFVTALGRHLLSLRPNQQSKFLFMSKEEARIYNRKVAISRQGKNHKPSDIGPHKKFDRLITKVFEKLPADKRVLMGISKNKNWAPHCKKKAGYAQACEADGVDANMVGIRADHTANLYSIYGARPISGVPDSGGPPARHDVTMSKLLAGLVQYTEEFNTEPPHWDEYAIKQIQKIGWQKIMPCYKELPECMQALVPLAVAQNVYHYHKDCHGIDGGHPLFRSPLWTTQQDVRSKLFKALRGADTGQESVLSRTYADKKTDKYLWIRESKDTSKVTNYRTEQIDNKMDQVLAMQRETLRRIDRLERRDRGDVPTTDARASAIDQDCLELWDQGDVPTPDYGAGAVDQKQQDESSSCMASKFGAQPPNSNIADHALLSPPEAFTISDGMDVEQAWHGWHGSITYGSGPYPWKSIKPESLCLAENTRRKTLSLLSKIGKLVKFIQGDATDAHVRIDVSNAWDICKQNAMQQLQAEGITEWPLYGAFTSAYIRMNNLKKPNGKASALHTFEQRKVELPKEVPKRQESILAFFSLKGKLENMTDVIDIEEEHREEKKDTLSESEEHSGDFANAMVDTCTRDCFICPICPERGEQGLDLVVYRDHNALWQHWNAHHSGDEKPPLWKIHLVLGMKLGHNRQASWTKVSGARSERHPEYAMRKMREEILNGTRTVANGTFVELQPDNEARKQEIRWFAVIRNCEVRNGKITVQYCEPNSQKTVAKHTGNVWVESILRVGSGVDVPFPDVSHHDARGACSTPRKNTQDYGNKNSPYKTTPATFSQISALQKGSLRNDTATPSPKRPKGAERSAKEASPEQSPPTPPATMITPRANKMTTASPCQTSALRRMRSDKNGTEVTERSAKKAGTENSPSTPPQHDLEVRTIAAIIEKQTHSDPTALKCFEDANKLLKKNCWIRCKTNENTIKFENLMNPKYVVKAMARDGKCMYHCMLHILKAEGLGDAEEAPKSAPALRTALARFCAEVDVPEGRKRSAFGGVYSEDGTYLDLEESLETSYGGEIALFVFAQLYNVTIHCHAPESRKEIQTFKCSNPDANEYHVLLTFSWKSWILDRNKDPKIKAEPSYNRHWAGDHWQVLEASAGGMQSGSNTGASKKLEFGPKQEHLPASGASAAATSLKPSTARAAQVDAEKFQKQAPTKLTFDDAECFSDSSDAQIMLRAVHNSSYVSNAKTSSSPVAPVPEIMIQKMQFMEHDFGDYFGRVYLSDAQNVLHAFPRLNEDNRSFFLALGIGVGVDPFVLQCLFRVQAQRLQKTANSESEPMKSQIRQVLQPGHAIDYNILSWCWPTDFNDVSVQVIDKNGDIALFESDNGIRSKSVILKMNKLGPGYTWLRRKEQTATSLITTTKKTLLHVKNQAMRCPCISTVSKFDTFENSTVFLATALLGDKPSNEETETIWKKSVAECGLEYDYKNEKWTLIPDERIKLKAGTNTQNETDGSLKECSWGLLRTKLLEAFDAQSGIPCPAHMKSDEQVHGRCLRSGLASPSRTKSKTAPNEADSNVPCIFVDAGSESGRGLFQMMKDDRVTHVAGIEFQQSWFQLSVSIFKHVRHHFRIGNYRMPEVTLIHSCMLAQTQLLKWLYSITSIMWMNNFVFDKVPYFNSSDQTSERHTSKSLVPGNKYLSANAAFNLSQQFDGTTLIALLQPSCFGSQWNYTPFKPFQVSCTWSRPERKENVTILRHTQHLSMSTDFVVCSPTIEVKNTWDAWTRIWSTAVSLGNPSAYQKLPSVTVTDTSKLHSLHSETLLWIHLSCITQRAWFNSDIILAYKMLLTNEFQDINFEHTEYGEFPKGRLKRFKKKSTIFCMHVPDHWIALKLDTVNHEIFLCDSLPGIANSGTILRQMQDLSQNVSSTSCHEMVIKVPHQKNTVDCGVATCLFMLCLAEGIDPNDLQYESEAFMRQFRLRILADIVNNKVTRPKPWAL
jgi:hypothetical protein